MNRFDKQLALLTSIIGALLAFFVGTIVGAQEAHVNPQVVFRFDHRDSRGRNVMEAKDVRIAYTVVPIEESHPAPLSDDALLLCRPYDEGSKLFLRCGSDRYAVVNVGLAPKKQKKQEGEE